ncbi:MAG: hypothetical protein WAR59_16600 [Ignavibacteriaceae bacterium]
MKSKIFLTITLIISLVFVFGFSLKNKLGDEMTYKNKNASI